MAWAEGGVNRASEQLLRRPASVMEVWEEVPLGATASHRNSCCRKDTASNANPPSRPAFGEIVPTGGASMSGQRYHSSFLGRPLDLDGIYRRSRPS